MKIIRIDHKNQVNGDGLRSVIWVSGCSHHCPGCHNPETWDYNCGHTITNDEYYGLIKQLEKEEVSGITLSGGDPFYAENRAGLVELCADIKSRFPNKTIWCYTGYLFEEIYMDPLMKYIDVLIDGEYIAALNPGLGKCKWRGSTNQRIIDIPTTINCGKITELNTENCK